MIARATATFTRPANTTQYTAGDVVAGASPCFEIPAAADFPGGGGYIIGAQLLTDNSATTNASFRLWLFSSNVSGIAADNAAFVLPTADATARLVGYIDFSLDTVGQGGTLKALGANQNANLAFNTGVNTSLYGIITATAAYTPASAQNFYLSLQIDQV